VQDGLMIVGGEPEHHVGSRLSISAKPNQRLLITRGIIFQTW